MKSNATSRVKNENKVADVQKNKSRITICSTSRYDAIQARNVELNAYNARQ